MSGRRGVAVAAIAVAALLAGCSQQATPNDVDPTTAPPTTAGPGPAADPSVCGLSATADTGTLTAAPASTWQVLGTTEVPASEQAGPGLVDPDGLRRCFARTPEGALYAAANVLAAGMVTDLVEPVTDRLSAPGEGRDAALADLAGRVVAPASSYRVTLTGFALSSYTGQAAAVDVALKASNGAQVAQLIDLVWVDGDWKVQLTADGQMRTPMAQITSTSGYTPWGPTDG